MARKDFSNLKIETLQDKDPYFNHEDYIAGSAPFLRGLKPTMFIEKNWHTCIEIKITSIVDGYFLLKNNIELGHQSFYLKFSEEVDLTKEPINLLFNDLALNSITIFIDASSLNYELIKELTSNKINLFVFINTKYNKDLIALLDLNLNHRLILLNNEADSIQELVDLLIFSKKIIDANLENSVSIDTIAHKISFSLHLNGFIFENIAKLRASRLVWAMFIKQLNPKQPNSMALNLHSYTTKEQDVMTAIFGGSQTIISNEKTQLFFQEETFITKTVDPWAGSNFIEQRTEEIALETWKLFSEKFQ